MSFFELNKRFLEVFDMPLLQFSVVFGGDFFIFDIVAFDDYLKLLHDDYDEEKESMKMFIERKYGTEAVELMEDMMRTRKAVFGRKNKAGN